MSGNYVDIKGGLCLRTVYLHDRRKYMTSVVNTRRFSQQLLYKYAL